MSIIESPYPTGPLYPNSILSAKRHARLHNANKPF